MRGEWQCDSDEVAEQLAQFVEKKHINGAQLVDEVAKKWEKAMMVRGSNGRFRCQPVLG